MKAERCELVKLYFDFEIFEIMKSFENLEKIDEAFNIQFFILIKYVEFLFKFQKSKNCG